MLEVTDANKHHLGPRTEGDIFCNLFLTKTKKGTNQIAIW